jgi:hypothetical protein
MPEKATIERAKKDARQGKAPTTQAGEFVREEIHHVREGKHGARSPEQAIAIGLSKARKAGVRLPPKPGTQAAKAAAHDAQKRPRSSETSAKRSRVTSSVLKKEPKSTASPGALARQAHKTAIKRGHSSLHASAMKAVATKGHAGLSKAAHKAAATRKHMH